MGTLIALILLVACAYMLYRQATNPRGRGTGHGGTHTPPSDGPDQPEKPL
jgi:hypothetical protein